MNELMISISCCEEVKKAIEEIDHPCHKIVRFQGNELKFFQHPEPWNGNIEKAKILFVGSNPSYNESEEYPTDSWDNEAIYEYHNNRFLTGYYQTNRNKVLFWRKMRKSASWLLGIPLNNPNLEKNICLTEIVHCKSPREIGFPEACNKCVEKWMDKVLTEFNGKYIVVFSKAAQERFKMFEIQNQASIVGKRIIYVPHPSRWSYCGTDEEIKEKFFDNNIINGT